MTSGVVLGYAARFPSGRWLAALAGALWVMVDMPAPFMFGGSERVADHTSGCMRLGVPMTP